MIFFRNFVCLSVCVPYVSVSVCLLAVCGRVCMRAYMRLCVCVYTDDHIYVYGLAFLIVHWRFVNVVVCVRHSKFDAVVSSFSAFGHSFLIIKTSYRRRLTHVPPCFCSSFQWSELNRFIYFKLKVTQKLSAFKTERVNIYKYEKNNSARYEKGAINNYVWQFNIIF